MEKYITRGIQERIPLDIQILCWDAYEQTKLNGEYDYLHVFKIKAIEPDEEGFNCLLTHDTEVPEYHKRYKLNLTSCSMDEKIYIMDCKEYEIMLLGEEY